MATSLEDFEMPNVCSKRASLIEDNVIFTVSQRGRNCSVCLVSVAKQHQLLAKQKHWRCLQVKLQQQAIEWLWTKFAI